MTWLARHASLYRLLHTDPSARKQKHDRDGETEQPQERGWDEERRWEMTQERKVIG